MSATQAATRQECSIAGLRIRHHLILNGVAVKLRLGGSQKCQSLNMCAKHVTTNLRLWCMEAKKLHARNVMARSWPPSFLFLQWLRNQRPAGRLKEPVPAHAALAGMRVVLGHVPCRILIKHANLTPLGFATRNFGHSLV